MTKLVIWRTYFDKSPGGCAPGAEHVPDVGGIGGEDPLVVRPGFDGEVEEDDVEEGSAVGGIADCCLV